MKNINSIYMTGIVKILIPLILVCITFSGCQKENPYAIFSNTCQVFAGESFTVANLSTQANSYSWTFGDGGTSTATNPTYVYNTPGNYRITLVATNSDGNTSTNSSTITVVSAPPPNKLLMNPYQYVYQITQSWCWAASSQMALEILGYTYAQCELVDYTLANQYGAFYSYTCLTCDCCGDPTGYFYNGYYYYNCVQGGTTTQISTLLSQFAGKTSTYISRPLTFSEIQLEISQGRPVIIYYDNSFDGHFVVLFGYDQYGNVYIADPDSQSPTTSAYYPFYQVPYTTSFTYNTTVVGSLNWAGSIYKIGGPNCE